MANPQPPLSPFMESVNYFVVFSAAVILLYEVCWNSGPKRLARVTLYSEGQAITRWTARGKVTRVNGAFSFIDDSSEKRISVPGTVSVVHY